MLSVAIEGYWVWFFCCLIWHPFTDIEKIVSAEWSLIWDHMYVRPHQSQWWFFILYPPLAPAQDMGVDSLSKQVMPSLLPPPGNFGSCRSLVWSSYRWPFPSNCVPAEALRPSYNTRQRSFFSSEGLTAHYFALKQLSRPFLTALCWVAPVC